MQLLIHSVSQRLVSNIINAIVYTLLWDVAGNIQHMSLNGELLEVYLKFVTLKVLNQFSDSLTKIKTTG